MRTDYIGLAYRARKVTIGTENTIKFLRAGKMKCIILALDASELTKKKVYDKAKTYHSPVIEMITSE